MRLTFLGTRGEIEARTRRHRMHSALTVSSNDHAVMIDCGTDWSRRITTLRLDAIFLTHAHPDHVGGLKNGAPCRVFATEVTWQRMKKFNIQDRYVVLPRKSIGLGDLTFEAYGVEHSIIAPAVGYRVSCGGKAIFYVPDLVSIPEQSQALSGAWIYIGDGASVTRPLVRSRGAALIGHAPISVQLTWCKQEGVPTAVFTHCGSQIVTGDRKVLAAKVRTLGEALGIDARIAYDGLEITM